MSEAPAWWDGVAHLWPPYATLDGPAPLAVARTEGCRIHLSDGRVLIDGIASWWTACHGYNHPHIREAVERQLARMPHVMAGGLVHAPAAILARRLTAKLPGGLDQVFFSESGSVAVEVALKMAAQYWANCGRPERRRFVAFRGGYHGDTAGAMAVSDPAGGFSGTFPGLAPPHDLLALPREEASLAALEAHLARHADELAGMIVEPLIQGAGGMLFHPPEALRRLRALADRFGLLLICDEIFTGFGRTGTLFACEQANAAPDIITLSKALTGGTVPLAATVASRRVADAFRAEPLMHGPTFMANPLACAAANASLDLFEREPRLAQAAALESALERALAPCRELPGVAEVRVKGAVGVVELAGAPDMAVLRRRFVDAGVWLRPFGRIVYLTPAFTIADEELAALGLAVGAALSDYRCG